MNASWCALGVAPPPVAALVGGSALLVFVPLVRMPVCR